MIIKFFRANCRILISWNIIETSWSDALWSTFSQRQGLKYTAEACHGGGGASEMLMLSRHKAGPAGLLMGLTMFIMWLLGNDFGLHLTHLPPHYSHPTPPSWPLSCENFTLALTYISAGILCNRVWTHQAGRLSHPHRSRTERMLDASETAVQQDALRWPQVQGQVVAFLSLWPLNVEEV